MRLLVAYHGILTDDRDAPTWPWRLTDWLLRHAEATPVVITDHYEAGPFPRLNWFKNRGRAKALANTVELLARRSDAWLPIDMVAHSNGCNILVMALKILAERGIEVDRVILIGGAVNEDPVELGLVQMVESRSLREAHAWWSPDDEVISIPRWLKWPYGYLGSRGWDKSALPGRDLWSPGCDFHERVFPGFRHNDYFLGSELVSTFLAIAETLEIPLKAEPTAQVAFVPSRD